MAFQFKSIYLGDLRTESLHYQSQTQIITDAPTDNHGKGEAFSPTDLLCVSLANCKMTTMGIVAQRDNIDLKGMTCEIEKVMQATPRRIAEIIIKLEVPNPERFDEKTRTILRNAALKCPVAMSLSPDVKQTVSFNF
jgi:putative redox protein